MEIFYLGYELFQRPFYQVIPTISGRQQSDTTGEYLIGDVICLVLKCSLRRRSEGAQGSGLRAQRYHLASSVGWSHQEIGILQSNWYASGISQLSDHIQVCFQGSQGKQQARPRALTCSQDVDTPEAIK